MDNGKTGDSAGHIPGGIPEPVSEREIDAVIARMPLEHRVGQLFLLAYPGRDPGIIEPLIRRFGIAGCYISQDNAGSFQEARSSSARLQRMAGETPPALPLMLGVDQEGAWGVLVPESHTGPGNLALGAGGEPRMIRDMYNAIGREMLSAGYNLLLAPCADVNTDPKSPIIGTRSFGEYPRRAASCVAAAVEGATASGIIPALKHFPGHGGTRGDSHREIPMVDKSEAELIDSDLLPFAQGIAAGAPIVMTSHIRFPAIDPLHPATLSPKILQGLLRDRLGFGGLILSDSMNMGAIRRHYDPAESTLMALQAGVDLVMLSEEHYDHDEHYLSRQIASIERVKSAVEAGLLSQENLNRKLRRILGIKLNRMITCAPPLSQEETREIIRIESDAARRGFVMLQRGLWPLPSSGTIICVNATPPSAYANLMNPRGIGPNQEKPAFESFRETLEKLDGSEGRCSEARFEFLNYEETRGGADDRLNQAAAVVAVTEDYPLPGEDFDVAEQQNLVAALAARFAPKMVILGLRSSYELDRYPRDITYICSYSSRSCSAIEAAKILAAGETVFTGEAPVSVRSG